MIDIYQLFWRLFVFVSESDCSYKGKQVVSGFEIIGRGNSHTTGINHEGEWGGKERNVYGAEQDQDNTWRQKKMAPEATTAEGWSRGESEGEYL